MRRSHAIWSTPGLAKFQSPALLGLGTSTRHRTCKCGRHSHVRIHPPGFCGRERIRVPFRPPGCRGGCYQRRCRECVDKSRNFVIGMAREETDAGVAPFAAAVVESDRRRWCSAHPLNSAVARHHVHRDQRHFDLGIEINRPHVRVETEGDEAIRGNGVDASVRTRRFTVLSRRARK